MWQFWQDSLVSCALQTLWLAACLKKTVIRLWKDKNHSLHNKDAEQAEMLASSAVMDDTPSIWKVSGS